jgi:peptide/nickel transport system permease protein
LGTDVQDRDVLSRIIYGARNTLGVSLVASLLAYLIGVSAGMLAAVGGRWIDAALSRINDALLSLPKIMLGLVIVAACEPSEMVLIVVAAAVYAPIVFRLARAISMEIAVTDYVKVAQLRGEGYAWIIFREIWPSVTMPLLSDFGLRTIYIILFISSLSFLGVGIQPPHADWGLMVRENLGALQYGASIWAPLAPAIAIASVTISINLLVDEFSVESGGKLLTQTR